MPDPHPAANLVEEIVELNNVWHALRELWPDQDEDEPSLSGLRDMKAVLQARLLREHPDLAFLAVDGRPSLPEPCYSVALRRPVGGFRDACHLPVRVARYLLTDREIAKLSGEA